MSKTATITTRVEPELKGNAEKVLKQLGMSTTQAINMFLKQIELHQGLPFDVQLSAPEKKLIRKAGLHQGMVTMADDFDEPLDDGFWLGRE